ncbi:unnamed protein product [Auanema sp. JU1783]|nr:unnamed protein product [Auanema sp. JU1783]
MYDEETVPVGAGYRLIISYLYDMKELSSQLGQINMKLSVQDMRDKTLFAIGSKNWPVLQSEFLRISDQIEKKRKQLEEMEINMMEALGKKDDIDDENAMDMLSKTYEIKEELDGLRLELVKNKEKLDDTTKRFSSITSWATNLVLVSDRLKQLNTFYIIPMNELIAICDVHLFDFTEENLNLDDVQDKLSELFWLKLKNILLREHRMIFRFILKKKCYLEKNISLTNESLKDHSDSLDDLHQLSSFIRKADCRQSGSLVREFGSLDWQRFVCEITKSCSYQFLSLLEKTSTIISQSCLKPEWIVLHISWSEIGDSRLKNIETELRKNESTHPDFRLIFSLNFVKDAGRIGCRYVQRFCLSALPNLESVIRSIFDLHHTKQAFDRLSFDCQKQFLQLICLHYGAYIRWPEVFQMDDLTYLLNLYQESIQSLIDTDQDLRTDHLYEGVVKPLYLTKLTTKHEKSILETIFLWIFQGIGKTDDASLRKILGGQWALDPLLAKLRHTNDKLLSGYCSQFLDIESEATKAEILLTTKFMLAIEKEFHKSIASISKGMRTFGLTGVEYLNYEVDYAEFSVRNALILEYRQAIKAGEFERVHYISSILKSSDFSSIDVRYIQSPRRFLAKIRAQFALSKRLPLSEVEIQSWLPIMEAQNKNSQTTLKFTNCLLCGARIEHGELKEYWKKEWEQHISIGIRAVKRNLISNDDQQRKVCNKNATVLCACVSFGKNILSKVDPLVWLYVFQVLPVLTKDGKVLCNVKIRTNYPQLHWKLRGSYIKTWMS